MISFLSCRYTSVTDPSCWGCLEYGKSIPCCCGSVAVVRPRVWFSRTVALAPKFKVLVQRSPRAIRKVDLLTIDRIRDPPTNPHELNHHADCSSMCSTGKRLSSMRSSRRPTGTASSSNRSFCQTYHPHPIATLGQLGQPRILSYAFEADMYAADVLRNDRVGFFPGVEG